MKAHRRYRRQHAPQVGLALSGMRQKSHVNEQGVRVITDFEVLSVSLVSAEQALHPSWRVIEVSQEAGK
jgi:hypothetical protein